MGGSCFWQVWVYIQDSHTGLSLCDDIKPGGGEASARYEGSSLQAHISGQQRENSRKTSLFLSPGRVPRQIEEACAQSVRARVDQKHRFWHRISCRWVLEIVGRPVDQHFSRDAKSKSLRKIFIEQNRAPLFFLFPSYSVSHWNQSKEELLCFFFSFLQFFSSPVSIGCTRVPRGKHGSTPIKRFRTHLYLNLCADILSVAFLFWTAIPTLLAHLFEIPLAHYMKWANDNSCVSTLSLLKLVFIQNTLFIRLDKKILKVMKLLSKVWESSLKAKLMRPIFSAYFRVSELFFKFDSYFFLFFCSSK